MKLKNKVKIFPALIIFYLFLLYFFLIIQRIYLFFVAFLGIVYCFNYKKLIFTFPFFILFFYFCFGLSTLALSKNISAGMDFAATLVIALLIISYRPTQSECNQLVYGFEFFILICVIGCIWQIIDDDSLLLFNSLHFNSEKTHTCRDFIAGNALVGFSYQTGVTGFYLALFVGLILCALQKKHKKIIKLSLYVILIFAFYLLLMTGKRGFLLFTIIYFILFLCLFNRTKILKILLFTIIAAIVVLLLFKYTEMGHTILKRSTTGDISTGRWDLYEEMINDFKRSPLFGNGFGSSTTFESGVRNGHNIYLQLLSENGIIGFALMMIFFSYNLFRTFRLFFYSIKYHQPLFQISFSLYGQLIFLGWGFTGNPLYDVYPFIAYLAFVIIAQSLSHQIIENK